MQSDHALVTSVTVADVVIILAMPLNNNNRNKIMFTRNRVCPMHFDSLRLILNCTATMLLSSFAIIITEQLTLSVTRPFNLSPELYYKWSIVTMCLSCTVMEIWRLRDNGP